MRFSDRFAKGLKQLPPNRADAAIRALTKFMTEPSLPSLRFRPLVGLSDHFIINSVHGDRVILRKDGDDYVAEDTGPHDNVYRRWQRRK